MSEIRPEREYTARLRCADGGTETAKFVVPPGTEEYQDNDAMGQAADALAEWIREGEWPDAGARVRGFFTLEDADYEWDERSIEVDVPPNHAALMLAAVGGNADTLCGLDPDDHDWTSEGEGGCEENPGVWSTGGTSHVFHSHCRRCGLRRVECTTGSQYNPGEHDTTAYAVPADEN